MHEKHICMKPGMKTCFGVIKGDYLPTSHRRYTNKHRYESTKADKGRKIYAFPEKQTSAVCQQCVPCRSLSDSPCKAELSIINKKQAGKKLLGETHAESQIRTQTLCGLNSWCVFWLAPVGQYLPSCDEEGYYRTHQCHSSSGQCWCVDRYGNEVAGSRTHGPADCGRQDIQACQVCVFKKMRDTQHDGKN